MLASPLSPFLDTYSISTSFLRCKDFCMVIGLLVLWSFFKDLWRTSRMVVNYLTRGTTQVYIPSIRSLLCCFVYSSFLVHLRYDFLIFSIISSCLMVSFLYSQVFVGFNFSERSDFVLIWQFHSVRQVVFINSMAHFSLSNSILCPDYIFSLRVLEFPVLFHYFDIIHVHLVIDFFPVIY